MAEKDVYERANEVIEVAKKLTTKMRKALKSNVFCGPGKSFPCHDCSHIASAKAFLGRSKFSAATKAKIAACINKKAEQLKCNVTKKAKASTSEMPKYIELSGEEKRIYSSDIFATTKALVEESIQNPDMELDFTTVDFCETD